MSLFRSIVFSAALAGLIVGIVITVAQQFGTVPLILKAEVYEKAAGAAAPAAPATATTHTHAAGEEHADAAWEPADGFERNAYTTLFNVVEWIGFGLVLGGALALWGRPIGWREGFLFGLAGFAAFIVAPTLGLPPELPGIPAAPLGPRQIWWAATVAATVVAIGLIAFRPSALAAILAVALLIAPHLVGAPQLEAVETNVPEALSHSFVVAVTLTTLISWTLLGGLTGFFYRRFSAAA